MYNYYSLLDFESNNDDINSFENAIFLLEMKKKKISYLKTQMT